MSIRKNGAAMPSTDAPPRPRVVQTLRRVNRLVQQAGDRIAREHGLTMQQWELLARLTRAGAPADQARLACGLHISAPTLTALVDTVSERGLVERRAYPDDRRRRLVVLTDEGRSQLERTPHVGRTVGQRMLTGFTREERDQLAALLQRCAENLEVAR
jgi:DNA-binding MarR family transcriptional regulator